jgi:dihydroorotate dehydrogenase
MLSCGYKNLIRPVLFRFDPEFVHNIITLLGEWLEDWPWEIFLGNSRLPNPIGLAAGFDYDGHLAKVMRRVGFGFNTVGTVTAKPYAGNPRPRLGRLVNSQSLFVNKGFKNDGVVKVDERLRFKDLKNSVVGISLGASNLPEINTLAKAIDDYLLSFEYLKGRDYVKYFELNISCPNLAMPENFVKPKNFGQLVKAIKPDKPTLVKMPNEIAPEDLGRLVKIALDNGLTGVILSNLVKDRTNPCLNPQELKRFKNLKGNFSGKPCFAGSNKLIAYVRKTFGRSCVIIGCGGVFTAEDALIKFSAGADLVQLVTGLVFEGPGIAGKINRGLGGDDKAGVKIGWWPTGLQN